jgi:hypothetical protein
LEKFWKLEKVSENPIYTKEENLCEQLFKNTTVQDENNRFIVNLPVRENIEELGESRSVAMKRLIAIERKLSKQPSLKNQYIEFMNQYESLGHMSKVISETKQVASPVSYYLPHSFVTKDSTSRNLRVVFDASTKTSNNISLNDKLMVGPTIQNSLFSIILRFRKHSVAISADIRKMYR